MTDDRQPEVIPGAYPGVRYEATWGRATARSKTFIARVHLFEPGGGGELWHCSDRHPTPAEAQDCAIAWTRDYARNAAAQAAAGQVDQAGAAAAMTDSIKQNLGVPVTIGQTRIEGPSEFDRAQWHLGRALNDLARDLEVPAIPGIADLAGRRVPAPGPALQLAKLLEGAAVAAQRNAIGPARAAGLSWDEIAERLGLGDGYASRAEAAYEFAVDPGHGAPPPWNAPVVWDCAACLHKIADMGPFDGIRDGEIGHTDDCTRHLADIAAEDVVWQDEPGED